MYTSKFSRLSDALQETPQPLLSRAWVELGFVCLARILIWGSLAILAVILVDVCIDGMPRLSAQFFTSFPSRKPEQAGILAGIAGSFFLMLLTVAISLPIGVGAAVYLEEYSRKGRMTRVVELCIANLAGVPSVIFGLLGLCFFVRIMGMGRSLLAGACTLSLLVLPVIIMASREALKSVPRGYREGALALGATQWQTIWRQVLPVAVPGILTGCILAFSRALGETAPLLALGALAYVASVPESPLSAFTTLPIQAYNWISRPQEAFHANAAAALTVLILVMVVMNVAAVWGRARFQRRQR